eukprot:3287940-Rhodomonas_salina.1
MLISHGERIVIHAATTIHMSGGIACRERTQTTWRETGLEDRPELRGKIRLLARENTGKKRKISQVQAAMSAPAST